ncbi:MAG: alcohol dehydrogenase catalytic domain-containing protein, partial [Chloroflexi bacterium]|nr:alcohol dehydrogenase catalytic domain-containing protein [Chloroflexota bacterium]
MKGAAAGQPGQVILVDYPEPDAGPMDIILAPTACGICSTDVKQVQKGAKDTRFALGHELVGRIIKTSVSHEWKEGQRVAVAPYLPCGQCFYCTAHQPALCTHLYEVSIS